MDLECDTRYYYVGLFDRSGREPDDPNYKRQFVGIRDNVSLNLLDFGTASKEWGEMHYTALYNSLDAKTPREVIPFDHGIMVIANDPVSIRAGGIHPKP